MRVGERGATGSRGVGGERGPKGDHGQQGDRGATGRTEPHTLWLGWRKSTWMLLAFLAVIGSGASATYRVEQVRRESDKAIRQESINRAHANCLVINTTIDKIRTLVLAATSGNLGVDYTTLPEFQNLETQDKAFFLALKSKSQTEGNPRAREEFLKGLDTRDCNKEYPTAPVDSKQISEPPPISNPKE